MNERARYKPYRPDGRKWCCYKDDAVDDTMQVIRDEPLREGTTADSPRELLGAPET